MPDFKFSLISDMHVDFPQHKTPYEKFEQNIIVAGDTSNGLLGLKFLQKLKRKGFNVFAIDGNHEHYSNLSKSRTAYETEGGLLDGLGQTRIEIIQPDLTILSCNGWYPVSDEDMWRNYMNDSRLCDLDSVQMNRLADEHASWMHDWLDALQTKVIVVTHTAPCEETLNPDYFGYFSNEWYWNPLMRPLLSKFADKILVWCHGHTHAPSDKVVDGVRVVCNPRGYPGEVPNWTPKTIEVSW